MTSLEKALLNAGLQLLAGAIQGNNVATAEKESIGGKDAALANLKRKDGCVCLIFGKRESGKTILAYRLAEFFARPTYMIAPNKKTLPWIKLIDLGQIEQIPANSTLILDDLPVYMSSRDYNDQEVRVVEKFIPVCRHKGVVLIFCSQTSGFADRWVLDADAIFLKPSSLLYADLERPAVKKLADKAYPHFEGQSEAWLKRHVYMVTHEWEGLISISQPSREAELPVDAEFKETG